MISFPNAKINLGLNVAGKRPDGYHNLETVFYPVKVHDALEIITSTRISFATTGFNIDDNAGQNLCLKAYDILKKDYPGLPGVQFHLHKNIPIGAGLGGGSSDAAYTLTMLNKKFRLHISKEKLADYALALGSDCPFFIYNKPCFASGRGEILEPLQLDLSAYTLALINPAIHVSTKLAFAHLTPSRSSKPIKQVISQPIETWKDDLQNDFEEPVFRNYPEVKKIKEMLYERGAAYAGMSGSGSTVYALFKLPEIDLPSFPPHYISNYVAGYTLLHKGSAGFS